ncbi:MAG: hypothetical protein FalmKO_45960 [Falsiruegeria mediterranea]
MQKIGQIQLPTDTTNAFEILALCQSATEKANSEKSRVQSFLEEAVSGNHEHLLRSVLDHFEVVGLCE